MCVILYVMLLKHRTFKQIVIACIFFGFWIGLGGLIFWANYEPSAPGPSAPREAQALEVAETKAIKTASNKADLVAVIRNPNADAGSAEVKYKFIVKNGSQIIKTISGSTFVLPSDQKYVMAFNQEYSSGSQLSLELSKPQWTFVTEGFQSPNLVLINKISNTISGTETDTYQLKGVIANQGNVDYTKVQVGVLGFDNTGEMVGAGETFIGSLKSLERREFTVQWPLEKGSVVSDLKIHPEVNVFLSDAVEVKKGQGNDPINIPTPRASSSVLTK